MAVSRAPSALTLPLPEPTATPPRRDASPVRAAGSDAQGGNAVDRVETRPAPSTLKGGFRAVLRAIKRPLVSRSARRPSDSIGAAMQTLGIGRWTNYDRYGHFMFDPSILKAKETRRRMKDYQAGCGDAAVWDALVRHTDELVKRAPVYERTALLIMACLHALYEVPPEHRETLLNECDDLLNLIGSTDFPAAISVINTHVVKAAMNAPVNNAATAECVADTLNNAVKADIQQFVKHVTQFALRPSRVSLQRYDNVRSFASFLAQSAGPVVPAEGVNNLAAIGNFASLLKWQREQAMRAGTTLLYLCGTPKLPLEMARVFAETESRARQWVYVAERMPAAVARVPLYVNRSVYSTDTPAKVATVVSQFHTIVSWDQETEPAAPLYSAAAEPPMPVPPAYAPESK